MMLSIVLSGDAPPDEFRIFAKGWNDSTKGRALFDAKAAKSVMVAYRKHGTELMLDYGHASLDHAPLDPAQSGKAAGWFKLELRGGELWAVNVRWTASAAKQLDAKEFRYMSPAFHFLDDDGRIGDLLNVALTNLPATHDLTPLMVASRLETRMLTPEMTKKALDVIAAGDKEAALQMVSDILAAAAGGEESDPDPLPDADPLLPLADDEEEDPSKLADDEEDPEELAVACNHLVRLTGKPNMGEAVRETEVWRLAYLDQAKNRAAIARERKTLEAGERARHCRSLVNGGMAPAMVWADTTVEADKLKPSAMMLSMPLATLRAEAKKANAVALASGGSVAGDDAPAPPAGGASAEGVAQTVNVRGTDVQLSAIEVRQIANAAKSTGMDLAVVTDNFAEIKLRQGNTAPLTLSN